MVSFTALRLCLRGPSIPLNSVDVMQVCNAFIIFLATKPSKNDSSSVWKFVTRAAVLSREFCVSNSEQHAKQTGKTVSDREWVRSACNPGHISVFDRLLHSPSVCRGVSHGSAHVLL
jgi:hypothetical protein